MRKAESEQPVTDAEIAERMDKAIRRSFTMPPGKKPATKRKPVKNRPRIVRNDVWANPRRKRSTAAD